MIYIITGTSSGLGLEMAKRLLAFGSVIGLSRTIGKADSLMQNPNFSWYGVDLSKKFEELAPIIESQILPVLVEEEYSLIMNAAQFYVGDLRLTASETQELFQTNLFSIMSIVNMMLRPKLKRILFINSISGLIGQSNQHEYAASKHALKGFSTSLARQAKDRHYDVMSINPGGINTELWARNNIGAHNDFIDPGNLADLMVAILKIPQRIFIDQMIILPPSDL